MQARTMTSSGSCDETAAPQWERLHRPSARALAMTLPAAALVAIISCLFLYALRVEKDWIIPAVAGLGLGACVPFLYARGTRSRITADGKLQYGLGPVYNISVPLQGITRLEPLTHGSPRGIAVHVALEDITFINRKGPGYPQLRRNIDACGAPVIIEHATANDLAKLQAIIDQHNTNDD